MTIELFRHNKDAYDKSIAMLEKHSKAAVIHPTGSGKSFIAFSIAASNPGSRLIWASPSEYIYETQINNLRKEYPDIRLSNIEFTTYASLMMKTAEQIEEYEKPEYIILDEFHRCGAEEWGKGVRRLLDTFPDAKILGLSATHIRYLDNRRDMADELFSNNIASYMTLGEAIALGILKAPKYVIAMYSYDQELAHYHKWISGLRLKKQRDIAGQYYEKLKRAVEQADGLDEIFRKHMHNVSGKYIVFCSSIEHMNDAIGHVDEWFGQIDKFPDVYAVYSESSKSKKAFDAFKNASNTRLKLLFCIDMLNEGIHISNIDGVILLRPTTSPIIYKQQIGRAITAASGTTPLILDVVNNFESLMSIDSLKDEIYDAVSYYSINGEEDRIVYRDFSVIDEVKDSRELFRKLEKVLASSWEISFAKAVQFYEQYGHLEVPSRYKTEDGINLGRWLTTQRKVRSGKSNGILTDQQIERLDAIGMRWESSSDIIWERYYALAKKYYEKHGNLRIVISYVAEDGSKLGCWISNQRTYKKQGKLSEERINRLDKIGFEWDVNKSIFEHNYDECKKYYEEHGNLDMEYGYTSNCGIKLGQWLHTQRIKYRKGILRKEHITLLETIGIDWGKGSEDKWITGMSHAKDYYSLNGTIDAPEDAVMEDGFPIGKWVAHQKAYKRDRTLPASKAAALDELNITWKKQRPWDIHFEELVQYFNKYGNVDVPPRYVTEKGTWLGKWINVQKNSKEKLTDEQLKKLDSLGFLWMNKHEYVWEKHFREAKEYYVQHGGLENMPKSYQSASGIKLKAWLNRQKKEYNLGCMQEERMKKVEEIGFCNKKK